MADPHDQSSQETNWITESKLAPVPPKIDLVQRDRLLEILDGALARRLLLVIAPAGYGKSTLLYQWAASLEGSGTYASWLALDGNDSEERQFLAYVVLSLSRAGLDIGDLEVGAQNGFSESSTRVVLAALVEKLSESSDRYVIVLDDYHLVSNANIDSLLHKLIWEVPANATFVLSSRTRPGLDLPTLIAAGEALELGAAEIRLNKEETFSALGQEIAEKDADEIFHKTEGWPVAVQLARVQKQAQPQMPLHAGASSNLIASYLTDQVLASLPGDVREMLLDISVLDRFNAGLADAVRCADDSAVVMSKMQPLTALLVPLDTNGIWFRLHHLFAEYLQDTLKKESPARISEILVRACDWHHDEGQLLESVKYAARAGKDDLCAHLVLAAGGWKIILSEGIGAMRAIFRLVAPHVVSSNARLLIAQAYLNCKDGEYAVARGLLDMSATMKPKRDRQAFENDHKLISSIMALYEDQRDWTYSSRLDDFDQLIEHHDALEAGTLLCEQALLHLALGDLGKVDLALQSSFQAFRKSGSVLGLNYGYLHACVAALYRGDMDMARALTARALELAESNFGFDSGLKHMALVLTHAISFWSDEAKLEDLENLSQTMSHVEEYDGWSEIYLVGFDAALHLAEQNHEFEFAKALIERVFTLAQNRRLDRLEVFGKTSLARLQWLMRKPKESQNIDSSSMAVLDAGALADDPRSWQIIYQNAEVAAIRGNSEVVSILPGLIADARTKNLIFYVIRLHIALSLAHHHAQQEAESVETMIEAAKLASKHKVNGVFFVALEVGGILRSARKQLRGDDSELLTVNFITHLLQRLSDLRPNKRPRILSGREMEIIEQVALGQSNKEIARSLDLTENTIKFHLKSIYRKLKVNRRTQAIAVSSEMGLLD